MQMVSFQPLTGATCLHKWPCTRIDLWWPINPITFPVGTFLCPYCRNPSSNEPYTMPRSSFTRAVKKIPHYNSSHTIDKTNFRCFSIPGKYLASWKGKMPKWAGKSSLHRQNQQRDGKRQGCITSYVIQIQLCLHSNKHYHKHKNKILEEMYHPHFSTTGLKSLCR